VDRRRQRHDRQEQGSAKAGHENLQAAERRRRFPGGVPGDVEEVDRGHASQWRPIIATILVVDDLAANRTFLVTLLRYHGHRLIEAADGRAGLAAIGLEPPDLVITDVLMPVMDGYELLRQLRLDPATSAIPVVFYTAHYGEREARALALSSGVADVLAKPADSATVLEVVGRVLTGGPEPKTAAPAAPLTPAFDREHLRLLTDKLSDKAGDLRSANARLRALINIGLELASERDGERLLHSVCVAARDLFAATYVTLGVVDRTTRSVQSLVAIGTDATLGIEVGDAVSGILRTVVEDRRTLREENPGGDAATLGLPAGHPGVRAYVAAPIASPSHVYGWLCLVGNDGRAFTEDDEQLLLALSGQVGRIYENGYFYRIAQHRADVLETEIEKRIEAESALRAAEERMRFALEAAGVGIWDMDVAAGTLQWSTILESQYGLSPGTFGGTFEAFIAHVHPLDRAALVATMAAANHSGADFAEQHRTLRPDGEIRWLSGAGRIHLGERGEPVRGVGISLDITERLALEEQFRQAQKLDAIGQLACGVAHDFNNLLTVILGFCELLLEDGEHKDHDRADITEIQKAGTRAAGLTRQLLAFSRKQLIEPTLIDLNTIVADMRVMFERLIGDDVTIVLDLRPTLGCVKADRGQVEQIVMNLVLNARDAMPGGGTLTIATGNVELDVPDANLHTAVTPGPHVMLSVADTGRGMSPEVQARLFEPFFTTKERGKGTGLGLATVHGIAVRSGGSVSVESQVGAGTVFKVFFPKAGVLGTAIPARLPPAGPRTEVHTVLVVDDAEGLTELARRLLARQGYAVLIAANAEEAVQLFEKHPSIDVLLTDVVMPGASGPELTRQLVERRPGLKVIYMSGYTEDVIAHHAVLDPGIAFLHKPVTSETLGRKIRDVLDR
jgi:PAS domain S-box-containing protein